MDNNQRFDVSVILPTYNEAENIPLIVPKIFEILNAAQIKGEVIIADDSSPDGTGDVAKELARKYPMQVLIRTANRGLSAAVIDGFGLSKAKTCVVMDADGSHPVESLPKMLRPLIENEADVAVGSRHREGGAIGDWPIHRRIISKVAAMLAKGITIMSDPTTGFMAIKKELLDGLNLSPIGWKIVLEIVVKLSPNRMIEVPITFEDRQFGESKMSLKEQWNYKILYRGLFRDFCGYGRGHCPEGVIRPKYFDLCNRGVHSSGHEQLFLQSILEFRAWGKCAYPENLSHFRGCLLFGANSQVNCNAYVNRIWEIRQWKVVYFHQFHRNRDCFSGQFYGEQIFGILSWRRSVQI
jgi:glycosyltransferase involved in cell wall biosynthesis